ncbi:MAG: peptidoglycan-binding protein [Acidimicrobiia bacterium]
MRRPTTRNLGAAAALAAVVLTGCSTGTGVHSGDGASAGPTAVVTLPPATPDDPTTTSPATLAEVTTTLAPTTTAAPTTLPPTTLPEPTTTVPVETTTTIPPGFELAPPVTHVVAPVGKSDGEETRALQQRLLELGFWLSGVDGEFGTTTRQAVMAFQKYNLLPPTGAVDQVTADAINTMPFRARAVSIEGDLIEINKTAQLLFIVRGGRTDWVLNTSTGNGLPYTEEDQNSPGEMVTGVSLTPDGEWKVNRERAEGWWEGDLGKIYRPKYFRGGVAVHGSGSVPEYPASHGCVRVSVPAMDFIWAADYMPMGTKVWVYA